MTIQITLEQLNDHRRTFPNFLPDTIDARIESIKNDMLALMPQPLGEVEIAVSIERSNSLNMWLVELSESDPDKFETVRFLPVIDQFDIAGL